MPTTIASDEFKLDLLNGKHNFAGISPLTYKMLLIKPGFSGVYDQTLHNVGTPGTGTPSPTNVGTDEYPATGNYVSGGVTMTGVSVTLRTDTVTVDWSTNPSWPTATISAVCGVIYESVSGGVVAIFDFGGTVTSTAGTFTITLPVPGATTSIIRLV